MANLYEILFRFRTDGTLRGSHVREWGDDGRSVGSARPMTQADIDAIGGILDYARTQRIAELTQEIADLKASHASEIEALRTQTADGDLASRLAEVYNTMTPEEQLAFSGELVIILGLIDRGLADLAAGRLSLVQVPEHLAEKKAAMIAAIQPAE